MATLAEFYTHLKTLCEQWFYNKSNIDSQMNNKVDKVSGKGLSTNDYSDAEKTKLAGIETGATKTVIDSSLSSTSTNPVQNKVINTALSNKVDKVTGKGLSTNDYTTAEKTKLNGIETGATKTVIDSSLSPSSTNPVQNKVINTALAGKANSNHTHDTSEIENIDVYSNIGEDVLSDQRKINEAINSKLGELSSIRAIKPVSTLPTASNNTLGYLYIISENSAVNVYYTEQDGSSYTWHKMDTDILDELSIDWSDIENKPSTFTPSSHRHYARYSAANSASEELTVIMPNSQQYSLGNIIYKLMNDKSDSTHTHGNMTNDGKITTTGTSGGNMVITKSDNTVAVDTIINVLDNVVQDLITYGSS